MKGHTPRCRCRHEVALICRLRRRSASLGVSKDLADCWCLCWRGRLNENLRGIRLLGLIACLMEDLSHLVTQRLLRKNVKRFVFTCAGGQHDVFSLRVHTCLLALLFIASPLIFCFRYTAVLNDKMGITAAISVVSYGMCTCCRCRRSVRPFAERAPYLEDQ